MDMSIDYFDLINTGNWGYDGSSKLLDALKDKDNCIFVIIFLQFWSVFLSIFTVFVVVETGFVVVVSVVEVFSVVDFSVEITCGITVFWLLFPLELTTFSRPMLAKTFSEGVIGNIIKNLTFEG